MSDSHITSKNRQSNDREEFLLKVASLYYEKGLTQEQIGKQMRMSRPTIVRALKQALAKGLVEIRLTKKLPQTVVLESAIEEAFGREDSLHVVVIDSENEDPKVKVAGAAASYLEATLRSNDVLGVGWSSTLVKITKQQRKGRFAPQQVVQLGGFVGGVGSGSAQEISVELGKTLGAPVASIPAPILVSSPALCRELRGDPYIAETMEWASRCNIGIVGIGEATEQSTLVRAGYLTENEIELVRAEGAVGDVLSHCFDSHGQEIKTPWSDRMISVDFATLKNIDNLVGIAAGSHKAQAVAGALRSGVFDTLIVDTPLAEALAAVGSS